MSDSDDMSDGLDFLGFSPIKSNSQPSVSEEVLQEDVISESDIAQANATAKLLHVYRPGINFVAESNLECLEAKDNKWYQCKIVEVNWGELDIMVHYNGWSKKYNEWVKMDSTRIRPITPNSKRESRLFEVGEKVLGFWGLDSKFYFGEIIRISPHDNYEIRFYDGYCKSLRSSQIQKISKKEADVYTKSLCERTVEISSNTSTPVKIERRRVSSQKLPISTLPTSPVIAPSTPTKMTATPVVMPAAPTIVPATVPAVVRRQSSSRLKGYAFIPDLPNEDKKNIFNIEIFEQKRITKRKPEVEQLFAHSKKKRKVDDAFDYGKSSSERSNKKATSSKTVATPNKTIDLTSSTETPIEQHPPAAKKRKLDFKTIEKMVSADSEQSVLEIDLGLNWKKVGIKRHGKTQWDICYVTPDKKKCRTRQQFIKNYLRMKCPITPAEVDFSIKLFKLEHEAKYGGVEIKFDADTKSAPSEASFSGIYEELHVRKPKKLEESFLSTSNSSSPSCSEFSSKGESEDDNNDESSNTDIKDHTESDAEDSTDSDANDSTDSDVKDSIDSNEKDSEQSDDDSSDSDDEDDDYHVANLPSVKLSQLLPQQVEVPLDEGVSAKETFKGFEDTSITPICLSPSTPPKSPETLHTEIDHDVRSSSPMISPNDMNTEYGHMCSKKGCEKSFRKENLLQMHIKHYHPELIDKNRSLVPNVPDLVLDAKITEDSLYSSSIISKVVLKVTKSPHPKTKKSPISVRKPVTRSSKEQLKSMEIPKDDVLAVAKNSIEVYPKEDIKPLKIEKEPEPKSLLAKKREQMLMEKEGVTTRQSRRSETLSEFDEETTESITENQSDDSQEAIINCGCKSIEEDGLMLQCDICLCWQHGACYNIEREDQVPDSYICSLCENPRGQRSSMKFRHHQNWLKEGRLPQLSIASDKRNRKLENIIKRGHELSANVLQLSPLIHSLRLELSIAKGVDHPKFVMWHKKWIESDNEFEDKVPDSSLPLSSDLFRSLPSHTISNILNGSVPINTASVDAPVLSTTLALGTMRGSSAVLPSFSPSKGKITVDTSTMSISSHTVSHQSFDEISSKKPVFIPVENVKKEFIDEPPIQGNDQNNQQCEEFAAPDIENHINVESSPILKKVQNDDSAILFIPMETVVEEIDIPNQKLSTKLETVIDEVNPNDLKLSSQLETVVKESTPTELRLSTKLDSVAEEVAPNVSKLLPQLKDIIEKVPISELKLSTLLENVGDVTSTDVIFSNLHKNVAVDIITPSVSNLCTLIKSSGEASPTGFAVTSQPKTVVEEVDPTDVTLSPQHKIASSEPKKSFPIKTIIEEVVPSDSNLPTQPEKVVPIDIETTQLEAIEEVIASDMELTTRIESVVEEVTSFDSSNLSKKQELIIEEVAPSNQKTPQLETAIEEVLPNDVHLSTQPKAIIELAATANVNLSTQLKTDVKEVDLTDANLSSTQLKIVVEEVAHSDPILSTQLESDVDIAPYQNLFPKLETVNEVPSPEQIDLDSSAISNEDEGESLVLKEFGTYIHGIHESEKTQQDDSVVPVEGLKELLLECVTERGNLTKTGGSIEEIVQVTNNDRHHNQNAPDKEIGSKNAATPMDYLSQSDYTASRPNSNYVKNELKDEVSKNVEALEVPDDFDIELGGLSGGSVPDINDGTVLSDLLAHSAFDQLVQQEGSDLAPLEQITPAPIFPENERIEPAKCKVNLLKHIECVQDNVFKRFDYIERQMQALEADMGLTSDISKEEEELLNNDLYNERDPATIQARSLIKLLLSNYDIVTKIANHAPAFKEST